VNELLENEANDSEHCNAAVLNFGSADISKVRKILGEPKRIKTIISLSIKFHHYRKENLFGNGRIQEKFRRVYQV